MNPPDLATLWNSPANRPHPAAWDAMLSKIRDRQRRRRRLFLGVLITASIQTILLIVSLTIRGFGGSGGIDGLVGSLSREWAAVFLLGLQTAAVVRFWILHGKGDRLAPGAGENLRAGLEILWRENRRTCARQKTIAALLAVMAASMPLVVNQLQAAGKAGEEIRLPFLLGVPVLAVAVILGMAWHFLKILGPEGRALNEQLAEIREPFITPS